MIRICEKCGKQFNSTSNIQRFCTKTCRRSAWKELPYYKEAEKAKEEKKEKEEKKTKQAKKPKGKSLQDLCREARKAGMTYGKYILYLEKGIKE